MFNCDGIGAKRQTSFFFRSTLAITGWLNPLRGQAFRRPSHSLHSEIYSAINSHRRSPNFLHHVAPKRAEFGRIITNIAADARRQDGARSNPAAFHARAQPDAGRGNLGAFKSSRLAPRYP